MIRHFFLGVILCVCVCTRGSPLKEYSATRKYLERIQDEVNFRAKNDEPLLFAFEQNDGSMRVVDLTTQVQSLSYIAELNYSLFVDFYLFQRINTEIKVTRLPVDAKKILEAGFQKTFETKVVIHGFSNDLNSNIIQLTSRSYAENFDYNVVAVDWGKISNNMIYPTARYHVKGVGEYVGEFLSNLYNASLIKPSSLHLIGHSLGAHVAGYAGKAMQKEGWTIGRISGLDPAGVLFHDPTQRLTKDDADQLDVIHTCMKYLGIGGNIGHVDFYPNGGTAGQPGCNFDWSGTCSHGRAYEFFVESIERPKAFIGKFCKNEDDLNDCDSNTTAVMGAWLSYKQEGAYFLETASYPPFGLGEKSV